MELTFSPKRYSGPNGMTLLFRVFQGSVRISIIDANNKMIFDRPIRDDRLYYIHKKAKYALNNTVPGQSHVMVFNKYSVEKKGYVTDWFLTIRKNDKQCFEWFVESITDKQIRYSFLIRGNDDMSTGTDPIEKPEASAIGLEDFINYTNPNGGKAVLQQVLSNNKQYWTNMRNQGGDGQRRGGGRSYGGGNRQYQPSGGGGQDSGGDDGNYF